MTRKELQTRLRDIRANNNDLWLKLLDIALDCNPVATKSVLEGISANDQKVIEVVKALCKT